MIYQDHDVLFNTSMSLCIMMYLLVSENFTNVIFYHLKPNMDGVTHFQTWLAASS